MAEERRFHFADPKKVARDRVGSGSRTHTFDAALLATVESFPVGDVHAEVRSSVLSENFLSTFALASSQGWDVSEFDRWLMEAHSDLPTAVGVEGMTDVGKPWVAIGRSLGFDGLRDDLAVIVDEPHRPPRDGERLVRRVREIVERLDEAGHAHAAVLVVGAELPHALRDRIYEAGGEVLEVPKMFYELSDPKRRSFLLSLFPPAEMGRSPAPCAKNPDAVPGDYVARNPDLTEGDVAEWRERLAGDTGED